MVLLGFAALLLPALGAGAETEEGTLPTGRDIVERVNGRDDGNHSMSRVKMELIDRRGKKRIRQTVGYRKYYGKEKRSALFFESPQNVKGTAFLTFDHPEADRDDDQWLYLPALRKVRRISSSDRGGYFLGTDFSYEDMKKESKFAIEDYEHKTLGVEEVDGHRCYRVEHVPVSDEIARELGYGRVVSYIDPTIWMARKSEFWDVQRRPLKTVHTRELRPIDGIWTTHRIEAENRKTGHRTVFTFFDVDYATAVKDDIFTERALRRGP
jgi:outer membrane lipoprotein-sorting protein